MGGLIWTCNRDTDCNSRSIIYIKILVSQGTLHSDVNQMLGNIAKNNRLENQAGVKPTSTLQSTLNPNKDFSYIMWNIKLYSEETYHE